MSRACTQAHTCHQRHLKHMCLPQEDQPFTFPPSWPPRFAVCGKGPAGWARCHSSGIDPWQPARKPPHVRQIKHCWVKVGLSKDSPSSSTGRRHQSCTVGMRAQTWSRLKQGWNIFYFLIVILGPDCKRCDSNMLLTWPQSDRREGLVYTRSSWSAESSSVLNVGSPCCNRGWHQSPGYPRMQAPDVL